MRAVLIKRLSNALNDNALITHDSKVLIPLSTPRMHIAQLNNAQEVTTVKSILEKILAK